MQPERDQASIRDMLLACRQAVAFSAGMTIDAFRADTRTQSAVIHQVMVLGEACKRVSEPSQSLHPQIPWSVIARTRDILIHHYEGVDMVEVWRIATQDLPALIRDLEKLVRPE